jgi:hypothetical protein
MLGGEASAGPDNIAGRIHWEGVGVIKFDKLIGSVGKRRGWIGQEFGQDNLWVGSRVTGDDGYGSTPLAAGGLGGNRCELVSGAGCRR